MDPGEGISVYFLGDIPDIGEAVATLQEIPRLRVHETPVSWDFLLRPGANVPPSIIILAPSDFPRGGSKEFLDAMDAGHRFLLISNGLGILPDLLKPNRGSLFCLERPFNHENVDPPVSRAIELIDWHSRREASGLRILGDQGLSAALLDIYDDLSDPVLLVDADSLSILCHNHAARQLLGMGTGMRGENLLQYSHNPEQIKAAIRRRSPHITNQGLRRREGSLVVASSHISYYRGEGRDVAMLVVSDLSPEVDLQAELRRRQQLFCEELDSIATPILVIGFDHSRVHYVNKATAHKFGYSQREMIDREFDALFRDAGELHRLFRRRASFFTESQFKSSAGKALHMEVHAHYMDEESPRFIVTLHDATERQQMVEEQKLNLERLREAQRMARIGDWSYDLKNRLPRFPPETLRLHGLDGVKPMSSEEYAEMIPWEDRQEIDAWIDSIMGGSKPYPIRYNVQDIDGTPRYFVMNAEPMRDELGQIVGLTGTSQDISEIEHLEQKNTLYLQTFDMMDLEVLFLSEKGEVVECNQSFARARGRPKDALKGHFVSILNPRYTRDSWVNFWNRITQRGRETREEVHLRGEGEEYDVLISINLLDYLEQKLVLCIITDITEFKANQKRLQASLKEKTALLQEIHHRMGNNLQTISSLVSFRSLAAPSEEVSRFLEEVDDHIMGIASIHNSMYQQERYLDIDLIQHLEKLWVDSGKVANAGHGFEIIGEPAFMDINRVLPLTLAVSELIHNSLRHAFSKKGGKIELRIEEQEDYLLLHYRDNGRGYPPGCRDSDSAKLGISLMQTLVRNQLKGDVHFYNDNGANVKITLPKGFFNRSIRDPMVEEVIP